MQFIPDHQAMTDLMYELVCCGFADDEFTSTDGEYVARIGRRLLMTDRCGIRDYICFVTDADAKDAMAMFAHDWEI